MQAKIVQAKIVQAGDLVEPLDESEQSLSGCTHAQKLL